MIHTVKPSIEQRNPSDHDEEEIDTGSECGFLCLLAIAATNLSAHR